MKHLHEEVRIEAPVEHVWAFMCDTSHWPDWMPRARYSDFSGPVDEVGTTYVQTSRLMGFESKEVHQVAEIEPLRLVHDRTDTGPQDSYFRLEPDGEATHVVFDFDYELPGRMPGFVKDLVAKGLLERHARSMMADLKALAEVGIPAEA